MIPDESKRAGSTLRVLRIPGSTGSSLILEQGGRHFDLSHGLGHARRGDLLDLIVRGQFDRLQQLSEASRPWPAAKPAELLTPFEPRHVGKILALAQSPRELFEHASADCRIWFSNRSPATLIANAAQVQLADLADPVGSGHADEGPWVHEVFLAGVIARRCSGLEVGDADSCVAGFMVASDFTRRSLDGRPRTPRFGRPPAGALAIGPAFVPRACFEQADLTVSARRLRGDVVEPQRIRHSGELLGDVALAVAALSRLAILHPGDLVLIPTGVGLGAVDGGDEVRCSIEGIGELSTSLRRRTLLRQQA